MTMTMTRRCRALLLHLSLVGSVGLLSGCGFLFSKAMADRGAQKESAKAEQVARQEHPPEPVKQRSFPEGEREMTRLVLEHAQKVAESAREGAAKHPDQRAAAQLGAMGERPPAVLRVFLLQDDWGMVRHEISGAITARNLRADVYYRGLQFRPLASEALEGCYKWQCELRQDEQGGSFGSSWLRECEEYRADPTDSDVAGVFKKYDCAAIEALPGTPPQ